MATYDLAYPGAAIDAILNTAYFLQEAGYIFQGSASEYSGTPSKRVWLIAPAGFTGYGISSPVPQGSIGICLYNGTSWLGKIINVVTIDSTPTQNSGNAVSSGGAYAAINQLSASVTEALENLTFTDTTPSAFQDEYINMKVSTTEGGVERILTYFTILAATTSKAGLLSAEDKVKIDSFLTGIRSMQFVDATTTSEQAIKLVEQLKWTVGGVQEVIDSITLLAATSSKAGLLSASDKAYIDALPATLTSLSNSISGALALMQSLVGYYVCDTAAGTAAKTVAATGYSLTNGGCIRIKMTNANTAANVTLNINSTGAKALYYDGAQASSSNSWDAGEVLEVYYDGTQYQCTSGGGGKGLEVVDSEGDIDFEISDESNNAIVQFANGGMKTKFFNTEKTPSQDDETAGDFSVSDENGNLILLCKDGNIRTKNFNSAKVVIDNRFDGKKISIIGDSISTALNANAMEFEVLESDITNNRQLSGYPTYYDIGTTIGGVTVTSDMVGTLTTFSPVNGDVGKTIGKPLNYNTAGNSGVASASDTWWAKLAAKLGAVILQNVSWSGASITSHEGNTATYKTSYAWHPAQINKLSKRDSNGVDVSPDIVIIYRGTNDFSHSPFALLTDFDASATSIPATDSVEGGYGFKEGLALTVKKIREAYPMADVYLCTLNIFKRIEYDHFPTRNGTNTLPEFNNAIREVSNQMGCGLIEFDKDGITFENCYPTYISDSSSEPTHPNPSGHDKMAVKAEINIKYN